MPIYSNMPEDFYPRPSDVDAPLRSPIGRGPRGPQGHSITAEVIDTDPYGYFRVQFKDAETGEVLVTTPNLDVGSRFFVYGRHLSDMAEGDSETVNNYDFTSLQASSDRSAIRVGDLVFFTTSMTDETFLAVDTIGIGVVNSVNGTQVSFVVTNVMTAQLRDGSITTDMLADLCVTTAKLANDAVTTNKINDAAVTTDKINDGAITNSKMSQNSVNTNNIVDGSVTTSKLDNYSVTNEKIASLAVDSSKIADSSIVTNKIADNAVTTEKIDNAGVTTEKIANNAVITTKVADKAITTAKVDDKAVTTEKIADDAVTTNKVADNAVATSKINNEAVTLSKLAPEVFSDSRLNSNDEIEFLVDEIVVNYKSNNLINPATKNRLDGAFISQWGRADTNEDYCVIVLPIEEGKTITAAMGDRHIAFFSEFVNARNLVMYTNVPGFISGLVTQNGGTTTTVPDGARYMSYSCPIASINSERLSYGSETINESYDPVIDVDDSERKFLIDEVLVSYTSDNLINPATKNRLDGAFISQWGRADTNEDYCVIVLPIKGGKTISTSPGGRHIAFFSEFVNAKDLVMYTNVRGFISGLVASSGISSTTVPDEARYMAYSCPITDLDAGTERLSYGKTVVDDNYSREADPYDDEIRFLLDELVVKYKSNNLINPATKNRFDGAFVSQWGRADTNPDWCAIVLPIEGGETISTPTGGRHIAFFSEFIDARKLDLFMYTYVPGFISGFLTQSGGTRTVPDEARYMAYSCPMTDLAAGTEKFNYGSTPINERYSPGVDRVSKILFVGPDMPYTTITSAVRAANNNDTIMIAPGTYREAVDCMSKKLRIKGYSRDSTILVYSNAAYNDPPLEMSSGSLEDITIIADGQNASSAGGSGAYCVHIDNNQSANESLQFKNVRFNNDATGSGRPCVGIGLRENFRLSFVNCELESAVGHSVFCHEQQSSNIKNQYIEFIDCSIRGNGSEAILLNENPAFAGSEAIIKMQRCIVLNSGGNDVINVGQYGTQPGLDGPGYLGAYIWTLDSASALNNESILDA